MPTARRGEWCMAILGMGLALVCAASHAAAPRNPRFENLSVEQGLPEQTVTSILQDHQGFMWFGTQAGLARFDGYRFLVYHRDTADQNALGDNFVTALYEDARGRLLVGTRHGLYRLGTDRSHFESLDPHEAAYRGQGNRSIVAMVGSPAAAKGADERTVWIATEDGLESFDTLSGAFRVWHHNAADSNSLASDRVQALSWDETGRLWVGTDQGLDRLTPATGRIEHFRVDTAESANPRRNDVGALLWVGPDTLWIGTQDGVETWAFPGGASKPSPGGTPGGLPRDEIRVLGRDRDGTIWIGTTRTGLFRVDRSGHQAVSYRHSAQDPNSLAADEVVSVFQDRGGTLWVGTWSGGISRLDLDSGGFERYTSIVGDPNTLSDPRVRGITGDAKSGLWFATLGGGVNHLDPATGRMRAYRHDPADTSSLPDDRTTAAAIDHEGRLWVATQSGFGQLDPASGRYKPVRLNTQATGLERAFCILIDRAGVIWVGTDGGLHRYDPNSGALTTFVHDATRTGSISEGRVNALREDRHGVLWVGTYTGLDRLDLSSNEFTHFRHDPGGADSLSHDRVTDIFEDHSGRLWIGTADGLNRMDRGPNGAPVFHSITRRDGLDPDIGSIAEDMAGRIWLSTDAGISRIDPASGQVRNYAARDGLITGAFYTHSHYTAPDGTIYFGGANGAVSFRPDAIHENDAMPAVTITELRVSSKPVRGDVHPRGVEFAGPIDSADTLRLAHEVSDFTLEYAALHYADPSRNRYAHQLVGYDPDWVETDASQRSATYTNLDPGQYLFRVKASNKDGVWNETGVSLRITILPPWWATWWFRTAAAMLLLGSAFALYRFRVRALTRQSVLLEQEVRARTAEVMQQKADIEQQKEDIEQAHSTLSVLGEIGREITATLDQDAILQILDRHVHGLLDATGFGIYLLDSDGKGLTTALHKEGGTVLPVGHVELGDPTRHTARSARERTELLVEIDPNKVDPNHLPGTLHTLSRLFAPLAIGDRLLGVMTIQSPQQHAYGERERLVFRTLCAYGAIALDNAAAYLRLAQADAEVQRMLKEQQNWLEQEVNARTIEVMQQKVDLEQAHSTLSVLGEIGREITTKLVEDDVCRTLDRHVHELLDATTFTIYLLDADAQGLTTLLHKEGGEDLPANHVKLDHPSFSSARCARERREISIELEQDEINPAQLPGTLPTQSALFSPLTIGDRLIGVMTIQSPRSHVYGERERLVFRTLCAYGAIALDNAAAYQRLAEADAEVQRVLREQQAFLEQEVRARTAEVVRQKEDIEQAHSTLSVLGEIGREITATLDESAVFQILDRHVQGLLDATGFGVYLLDRDGLGLTSAIAIENGKNLPQDCIDLASPTRLAARCARERREVQLEVEPDEFNPSHVPGTLKTLSALFAPLAIGDRLLGVMTIQSPRPHAYGERDQLVFRTLCAYGAIALDNAAAYRHLAETDSTLQRTLREQQAIYDNAAAAIFFVKDRVVRRCNRAMEEMLGYEPGELIGQSTEVYYTSRESWETQGRMVYPLIAAGKVAEGEWEIMRKSGERFWVSFRGRALDPQDLSQGSIWVAHDITERKHNETALLETKQRLEQGLAEVEQLNRQILLLGELTGFLQACPSADEAFACIGDFGPRLFPESMGALYLAEEGSDTWVEHGRWGGVESAHSMLAHSFLSSECWALRRSRTYRVDVPSGALCCPHVPAQNGKYPTYACLPLTAQGKTFGLLHIEHHQSQDGVEADRRHGLAVAMAEQIALSIANVQLREALLQQSIRDPLTGLYNRRYLQEALFREMAHSKRNQSTFAVMMIDVDHFKKFNDTFGHHAGDVVLQSVARTIEAQFRRSDVACRFGGEEFTVLLPGAGLELAQRLGNGVLEGIRELVLSHENKPLDRITASLGIALFPEHGSSPQALIEAADAALYQAKIAGRNRIVVCGSSAN